MSPDTAPAKVVLVVDDEEPLRRAICTSLTRRGYAILQASNGKEAFELLQAEKVSLVISDVRMPGGDGIGLLKNVMSEPEPPPRPQVILISGYSDVEAQEAKALGAAAFLQKPFDYKALFDLVRNLSGS